MLNSPFPEPTTRLTALMLNYGHMEISGHYRPFEHKTLIAVTNNERARLFCAYGRMIDEIGAVTTPEIAISHASNNPEAEADAAKEQRLTELYTGLSEKLRRLLDKDGYATAIVCVPEVNKGIFAEKMPADILKRIQDVIPKNLASMDVPHIVRILLEG